MHLSRDQLRRGHSASFLMGKTRKCTSHAQAFLAQAIANPPSKPGKYDVFLWYEDEKPCSTVVAWKSFTKRAVRLHAKMAQAGEEIWINAEALPNGIAINEARYVGTFRVEKAALETDD